MKGTAIVFLILISTAISFAQGNDRLKFLLNKLSDGRKSDYVMIFAHRGDWRNAPENSLQAYQNCIEAGIDGIEIDVRETKDGHLVIIHDQTLDRTTTGTGKVSDYTLEEIKQLKLKNGIDVVVNQSVPTFEEVLKLAKGRILIQVDKWPAVKDKVLQEAKKHNMLNQLVFRSSYNSEKVKDILGTYIDSINYIPVVVCNGKDDDAKLDDFMNNLKVKVQSLSFKSDNYPIIDRAGEIKKKGYRIWYNSMWASFNGGHDDELAVYDVKNSYGWLLAKGADIIFTDRPFLLLDYLEENNRR